MALADDWFDVAAEADLPEGRFLSVKVLGRPLLLARHGGGLHALDATCSHGGADLCQGRLDAAGHLHCPRHGGAFDLASGQALREPATESLVVHAIRAESGRLLVCLARPRGGEVPGHLAQRAGAFQRRRMG